MTRDPITVPADATLTTAQRLLQSHAISGLPVVDGEDRVIGVISQTSLLAHATFRAAPRHQVRVADAMTAPAVTIGAWAPIGSAARLLLDYHVHRVVVVDEEHRAVGILSTTDFVRLAVECAERGEL